MVALPFAVIPTPLGEVTSGNELAANPASHLGEFAAVGMTWRSSGATGVWARGDFGSAKPVDFLSMVAANALPGTTIRLRLGDSQAAVDGTASYDSGAIAFINPSVTRENGLYHSHLEMPSVQTRRWWRIDIGGHTGDFEAAAAILGQRLTPANYYSPGWSRGAEDLGSIEISRWGVAGEEPGLIFRTINFRFGWMSEVDFETKFLPLIEKLGKRGVAFWCFDPIASTYRQAKTYLGWLRNSLVATHSQNTPAGVRYEQEFDILSMI